jgi:hypothetical protein
MLAGHNTTQTNSKLQQLFIRLLIRLSTPQQHGKSSPVLHEVWTITQKASGKHARKLNLPLPRLQGATITAGMHSHAYHHDTTNRCKPEALT